MHKKAEQTAVLIFFRTASSEAAVKTFDGSSGKAGNALIAGYLIRKMIRTARSSGLPVFLYYDSKIPGKTSGERLADAMASVFEKGFSRVITVGNDSPELTGKLLLQTCCQLADH